MHWWLRNSDWLMRCGALVFAVLASLVLPVSTWAQVGAEGGRLDLPFGTEPVLLPLLRAAFQWGVMIIMLAAAIFIAIGAYMYLAASGNASMAQTGEEYIKRALMGLVLGLIGWIILNTITPQFTDLLPPELKLGG